MAMEPDDPRLIGSLERYKASFGLSVWDAAAAVGEALWWVAALDEFLAQAWIGRTRAEYYDELGAARHGRIVGGLAYLRNRANHQLVPTMAHRVWAYGPDGKTFPTITIDGKAEEVRGHVFVGLNMLDDVPPHGGLRFSPVAMLPTPPPAHRERWGRDLMYANEVAERDVAAVLTTAAASFERTLRVDYGLPNGVPFPPRRLPTVES